MVHAEQIEEPKNKQVCIKLNKVRTKDWSSCKTTFEIQYWERFKKSFPIKSHILLQEPARETCLLPSPKGGKVEEFMLISLFVQKVIRDMILCT